MWLQVTGDAIIAVAFIAMSFALSYVTSRRPDLAHRWLYGMLAVSLLAVGIVHVTELLAVFFPVLWLAGLAKAAAALVCGVTSVAFLSSLQRMLGLPNPTVLEQSNRELQHQIRERERAETDARRINVELEARVKQRTRELERSNEELERFAYIASHDLREPLRMVKSYTQLLARRYKGKLDPTADEFIDYAVEGCDRMGELIHDVLEYSRVGRREERGFVEADDALAAATQNLKLALEESGARLTAEPLPRLYCRNSDLIALLQNLIDNALKYRGEKPPQIHVAAQRREQEDVICVRDDGIGIDTRRHGDRIFGMFQRLHARGEYAGTGMGLALCKKIMETHGGRIWVESAPGQGATFFCAFPRRQE